MSPGLKPASPTLEQRPYVVLQLWCHEQEMWSELECAPEMFGCSWLRLLQSQLPLQVHSAALNHMLISWYFILVCRSKINLIFQLYSFFPVFQSCETFLVDFYRHLAESTDLCLLVWVLFCLFPFICNVYFTQSKGLFFRGFYFYFDTDFINQKS